MVARGKRDHAGPALAFIKAREGVEGAAELEGAHALQVLALEEHLGAEFGVHRARGHYRRAVGVASEALAAREDAASHATARKLARELASHHDTSAWAKAMLERLSTP